MIKEGPLKHAFEKPTDGVIRQTLTTLFVRDGMLVEESIERDFSPCGDYIDSVVTTPIIAVKETSQ